MNEFMTFTQKRYLKGLWRLLNAASMREDDAEKIDWITSIFQEQYPEIKPLSIRFNLAKIIIDIRKEK